MIGHVRHVVDMLIICDQNKTNIENTLNKLGPSIKFTTENELHE
jgi:hypothetical protein